MGQTMTLRGYVGAPDGTRIARATVEGKAADAEVLGITLAARLREAGAEDILSTLQVRPDAL
jgi:hydroxymethylbilane synthase